jgi:hypothetical protein
VLYFLGELEDLAGDLYAWRWPIAGGLACVSVAALALAARLRLDRILWRHRLLSLAGATLVAAMVLPAAWYALSPLWERSRLDEASPLAVTTPITGEAPAAPGSAAPFAPRVTHRGMLAGADEFHFGRGDALLIETAPGMHSLRFEGFSVRNGPDLFVYLTNHPGDIPGGVNLGSLKATDGNFNYDVPSGVDAAGYRYAIVWCRQFAVLFASAELQAA